MSLSKDMMVLTLRSMEMTLYLPIHLREISEEEIRFDVSKIKITTLDIEVKSENGFPDVESAAEEILLISIQDYNTKQIRTWGQGLLTTNRIMSLQVIQFRV